MSKMYLELVSVCVGYSDFLSHSLPNWLRYADKVVIVTDKKDHLTKRLCDFYNSNGQVECVQTDVFYENGAVFNKGKGINAGLDKLSKRGWVLHIDSDIWLPPHTRVVLDARHATLDREAIYGIDRLMCHGYDNWVKFLNNPRNINELYYLVQPYAFPMGSRVAHYNQADGWFPIGFFQLWHPGASGVSTYPTDSPGADHTDVLFSKQFPIGKRHLIPETFVIHLDSERREMGANWNGRKTKFFGPEGVGEALGFGSTAPGPSNPAPTPDAPAPPTPPTGYAGRANNVLNDLCFALCVAGSMMAATLTGVAACGA